MHKNESLSESINIIKKHDFQRLNPTKSYLFVLDMSRTMVQVKRQQWQVWWSSSKPLKWLRCLLCLGCIRCLWCLLCKGCLGCLGYLMCLRCLNWWNVSPTRRRRCRCMSMWQPSPTGRRRRRCMSPRIWRLRNNQARNNKYLRWLSFFPQNRCMLCSRASICLSYHP